YITGSLDGSVALYDIRARIASGQQQKKDDLPGNSATTTYIYTTKPALESGNSSERHQEAIMEVKCTENRSVGVGVGQEGGSGSGGGSGQSEHGGEVLSTISLDGRVIQWQTSKGLEHTELMRLKRLDPKTKQAFSNTLLSRTAAGTCFDFSPADPMFYIVGTEDGNIHKCSRSYPDFVDTYYGHMGAIKRLQWNSFDSDYFLSAGADGTIRLWHSEHSSKPILIFSSLRDTPNDICWSPVASTVFAIGMNDGGVAVWDLSSSVVDPVAITNQDPDRPIISVKFHENGQLLFAGDTLGCVSVFRLANIGPMNAYSTYARKKGVAKIKKRTHYQRIPQAEQGEVLRAAIKKETGELNESTPLSYTPKVSLLSQPKEGELLDGGVEEQEDEEDIDEHAEELENEEILDED
ncbi:MAG: putative WD repeat domain containing protein, partial [Streblomastix strix]